MNNIMYEKTVEAMRKNSIGRAIVKMLWPIKQRLDFYLKWVVSGRKRRIAMRSDPAYRQGLLELVGSLPEKPEGLVMIEIGSYRGESAELFLSSGRVSCIYCVDPWQPFYDRTDAASFTDMTKVENDFDVRFAEDKRVVKVKGTIDTFVEKWKGEIDRQEVDFVYIDGCHTKEATSHDIAVVIETIKPKIAVAGHDYVGFSGVREAVDERFGAPDRVFSDTSWIKVL